MLQYIAIAIMHTSCFEIFFTSEICEKNPKTKVWPLIREQMGVIEDFNEHCFNWSIYIGYDPYHVPNANIMVIIKFITIMMTK